MAGKKTEKLPGGKVKETWTNPDGSKDIRVSKPGLWPWWDTVSREHVKPPKKG